MKGIDHIGIAVQSLEQALPFYVDILQFKHVHTEEVESERVRVAFIQTDNCKIELLEPMDESSPVYTFLQKRGEGVHHIALETEKIEADIDSLTEKAVRLINQQPKQGAGGARVAFLHPKSANGVLYELCERQSK
ncbi:methylmalonyl-CoA epimerase [Caldibacillus lycopersici]|uniref:Methylmalonyl-CoA epimerase n=1 Tax=Perspicuibacillus lycopersici TaxID=1325689 RepID=A0AAE3ISH2_9BACI|nr:methylmalonyl-CoA epimerase [Perspicuibacillus lycopersici]MCU9613808.1 methylmalonyl-CoA epimerase [Perspicuibacillus lycopersici]